MSRLTAPGQHYKSLVRLDNQWSASTTAGWNAEAKSRLLQTASSSQVYLHSVEDQCLA